MAIETRCRIVVLIGGNGSNLQALIDQQNTHHFHIAGVISHRPLVYGLTRAEHAGLATCTLDHRDYANRVEFETALIDTIKAWQADLVVLAGFMRILSPLFIHTFAGKILNIHPSLLPKWKGLHTHQRVLEAKETEHGVSVHFVTEELDGGPLVAQVTVPVHAADTPETLAQRVHTAEHWLYPQVVGWFAAQRLSCSGNQILFDKKVLPPQGMPLTAPEGMLC